MLTGKPDSAVLALLIALGAAGCGGGAPSPTGSSSSTSVGIAGGNLGTPGVVIDANDQNRFVPATQSATVGEIIEWKNVGVVGHNIVFSDTDAAPLNDPVLGGRRSLGGEVHQTRHEQLHVHHPHRDGRHDRRRLELIGDSARYALSVSGHTISWPEPRFKVPGTNRLRGGTPYRIEPMVSALRGRCPGPPDERGPKAPDHSSGLRRSLPLQTSSGRGHPERAEGIRKGPRGSDQRSSEPTDGGIRLADDRRRVP